MRQTVVAVPLTVDPTVMRARWSATGVAAVLALTTCSVDEVSSHLVAAENPASLCTPAADGRRLLVAHDVLDNVGSETALVRDVRLVDADNLKVVSFDVLSHEDDGFRGAGDPIALSEAPPTIAAGGGVMVRVTVELQDPSTPGEAAAFEVKYSDIEGPGSQRLRTAVTMKVVPHGQSCLHE